MSKSWNKTLEGQQLPKARLNNHLELVVCFRFFSDMQLIANQIFQSELQFSFVDFWLIICTIQANFELICEIFHGLPEVFLA